MLWARLKPEHCAKSCTVHVLRNVHSDSYTCSIARTLAVSQADTQHLASCIPSHASTAFPGTACVSRFIEQKNCMSSESFTLIGRCNFLRTAAIALAIMRRSNCVKVEPSIVWAQNAALTAVMKAAPGVARTARNESENMQLCSCLNTMVVACS